MTPTVAGKREGACFTMGPPGSGPTMTARILSLPLPATLGRGGVARLPAVELRAVERASRLGYQGAPAHAHPPALHRGPPPACGDRAPARHRVQPLVGVV